MCVQRSPLATFGATTMTSSLDAKTLCGKTTIPGSTGQNLALHAWGIRIRTPGTYKGSRRQDRSPSNNTQLTEKLALILIWPLTKPDTALEYAELDYGADHSLGVVIQPVATGLLLLPHHHRRPPPRRPRRVDAGSRRS